MIISAGRYFDPDNISKSPMDKKLNRLESFRVIERTRVRLRRNKNLIESLMLSA